MKKKIFKTKNSEVWVENKIIMIKVWGKLGKEDVKRIDEAGDEIRKNLNEFGIIVDISRMTKSDSSVRTLMAEESYLVKKIKGKVALVYNNPVARVIGSFFLKINKPALKIKLFPTIEKAKEWIEEK
ncbi:MAG: STAS/SEC14 domain-containing protein [Candidatus Nealsonbacteria bacterium]